MDFRNALVIVSPMIVFGVYMLVDRPDMERPFVLVVALSAVFGLYLRYRRQKRGEKELPFALNLVANVPIFGYVTYIWFVHPQGYEALVALIVAGVMSLAMYYYFKH